MAITPIIAEAEVTSSTGQEIIPSPGPYNVYKHIYVANNDADNDVILMLGDDDFAFVPAGQTGIFSGLDVRDSIQARHDGTTVSNLHVTVW